jgi:CHAD domain-containing protein/CYTH domain-containing protein
VRLKKRHLRNLADTGAKRGIRLIAIAYLQDAEEAFARISLQGDLRALHDFRVALRKLRSHLRIYQPWLRESVRPKRIRQLRRIARSSNPARDLEVLIERLRELEELNLNEAAGVDALVQEFERKHAGHAQEFRDVALQHFPQLARQLLVGFSTYAANLELDGDHEERFGTVAARLCARLRDELRAHLVNVLSIEHQSEAHEARIAGKKVRYLLDPFARESKEAEEAIAAVKVFQDTLGHLHDLHVLLTEVENARGGAVPAHQALLAPIHEHVHELRARVYDEASRDYLEARAGVLLDLVAAAERSLLRSAHTEIERKFLLKRFPRLEHAEELTVTQGYVPGSDIKERVRLVESKEGKKFYRTLKAGLGIKRIEVEEETTEDIFKSLFALTKGHRVRKRRYVLPGDGVTWMVDRFLDRRLVIAEVELPALQAPLLIPRWLKPVLDREVTGEIAFTNEKLAK